MSSIGGALEKRLQRLQIETFPCIDLIADSYLLSQPETKPV